MVHTDKKLVGRQLPYSYLNDFLNQSAYIVPKATITRGQRLVNDLKEQISDRISDIIQHFARGK